MSYVIRTEVDISASREAVGDVLVDFPRYGEWSTFSRVDGTAQVGNRLSIKMPGLSFRPTVTVAEPRVQLQWSGTLLSERLFIGRHLFVLSPNPDGTTHLTNHEEFSGAVTTLSQRFHEAGRRQRLHSLQRWSQAAGGRPRHAADPHLTSPPPIAVKRTWRKSRLGTTAGALASRRHQNDRANPVNRYP